MLFWGGVCVPYICMPACVFICMFEFAWASLRCMSNYMHMYSNEPVITFLQDGGELI